MTTDCSERAIMPPSVKVVVKEPDVLKLVLDFLSSRELYMSMRSLERESGVINGLYSDDALFLRNLILDGQWDDALEFIQPLESIETFDVKKFRFLVLKHKFLEMLCMKDEGLQHLQMEFSIEEVVSCLNELEPYCLSKEDYSNLCLLLTLPKLTDHAAYKNWNPSNARVQCFQDIYPLVARFLPVDKNLENGTHASSKDRLVQLLIKGLVFESCVDFCQQRATAKDVQYSTLQGMLTGSDADDADLSLLSWLQSIPPATFSCPFEQKSLEVAVERITKPSASWSEQIMTPMTPTPSSKRGYPSPSPTTPILYRNRPWSAGSSRGLSQSLTPTMEAMLQSQGKKKEDSPGQEVNLMSRSIGSIHLSGVSAASMNASPLPTVAEDIERPSGQVSARAKSPQKSGSQMLPSTQPLSQLSQDPRTSSPDVYAEFVASKALFQQDLERQEKHRQQLQQLLQNEGATDATLKSHGDMGSGDSLASQSKMSPELVGANTQMNQITPISRTQNLPHYPIIIHSSTPKTNRFDPTATPEPEASPVLTKCSYPHSHTYQSYGESTTETVSVDPNQRLDESTGEILAPGGNLVNVTYLSPGVNHLKETSDLGSNPGGGFSPTAEKAVDGKRTLPNDGVAGSPSRMLRDQDQDMKSQQRYVAVTTLEDVQAIRAVTFDPTGSLYAVGANSKTLRICSYPDVSRVREEEEPKQPTVLFKRTRHHKGSIYCVAWSPTGNLIATGSNDKFIKLLRFDPHKCNADGPDIDMTMHDGTVRDLAFQPESNHGTVLVSGGAGDCSIYVTDCGQGKQIHTMAGHSGHVLSLYCWGAHMLASGSQDNTVRLWDLRTPRCVQVIGTPGSDSGQGTAAATVCVDPSGRLLASGHEDSSCLLYDIHGGRVVQTYQKHKSEVRSMRFSPKALYLMSGSYDSTVIISDLQGDLTKTLPSTIGAKHDDKVIQCRWHPTDFTFLSSSADRTVTLWAPLQ